MKKVLVLICLTCALAQSVMALDIIPANSSYYYQLGGGSDINIPSVSNSMDIPVGIDADANLGFSCSGFNPAISLANTFNQFKQSIQGIIGSLLDNATSSLAGVGMYLIQKASKGMYNLIQNTISSGLDQFHLSMGDCQTALNNLNNNKSPIQNILSVSDSQGWLNHFQEAKQDFDSSQGPDINNVVKNINKNQSTYGVPWMDGHAGGSTQPPLFVVRDVVIAGYNQLVNPSRALNDTDAPSMMGGDKTFVQYWSDPVKAADWAQIVLGELAISKKSGYPKTTRGIGLMDIVQMQYETGSTSCKATDQQFPSTCAQAIAKTMATIVGSQGMPILSKLKQISSLQMMATPQLILSIRDMPLAEQQLSISKWSEDIAVQNVIGEAIALRQLLIAGESTKPVQNLTPVLQKVQRLIQQLDQDMQDFFVQLKATQTLSKNTAQVILHAQQSLEQQAMRHNVQTQTPQIINGTTYTK